MRTSRIVPLTLALSVGLGLRPAAPAEYPAIGGIERLDPALDELVAADARIEKLCEGFNWAEGPVWKEGAVLFSDVPENVVFKWCPGANVAVDFLRPSGGRESTPEFREPGSNGLALDAEGCLVLCQHGARRVARLEKDGRTQTSLVERFDGRRFHSPNDLAIARGGEIYFTDPPYGLKGGLKSPLREMDWNGVYRISRDGRVSLLTKEINWPNGIALSPDERTLYVAVSDGAQPRVMAADLRPDGAIANLRLLFDATALRHPDRKGTCDGMKVDAKGNLFVTGPGGVMVLTPKGKHLGTILTGQATANCCWGDDGATLYMTADSLLCRVRTKTGCARR